MNQHERKLNGISPIHQEGKTMKALTRSHSAPAFLSTPSLRSSNPHRASYISIPTPKIISRTQIFLPKDVPIEEFLAIEECNQCWFSHKYKLSRNYTIVYLFK